MKVLLLIVAIVHLHSTLVQGKCLYGVCVCVCVCVYVFLCLCVCMFSACLCMCVLCACLCVFCGNGTVKG